MNYDRAVALLGLPSTSNITVLDVKKAFKQLSLKYHPDKNPGQDSTHFIDVRAGYDYLISKAGAQSHEETSCPESARHPQEPCPATPPQTSAAELRVWQLVVGALTVLLKEADEDEIYLAIQSLREDHGDALVGIQPEDPAFCVRDVCTLMAQVTQPPPELEFVLKRCPKCQAFMGVRAGLFHRIREDGHRCGTSVPRKTRKRRMAEGEEDGPYTPRLRTQQDTDMGTNAHILSDDSVDTLATRYEVPPSCVATVVKTWCYVGERDWDWAKQTIKDYQQETFAVSTILSEIRNCRMESLGNRSPASIKKAKDWTSMWRWDEERELVIAVVKTCVWENRPVERAVFHKFNGLEVETWQCSV